MSTDSQFSDKVFLVTGASSGIGEALSLLLASRGASVTLCGRDEARLEDVRKRCVQESGGHEERFIVDQGDLAETAVRKRCVQKTVDTFGKLDTLVPNAGMNAIDCSILTATEETFDEVMSVNVKAVFFLVQEAVPHLEKSSGNIAFVSSISTSIPTSPSVICPMTKAAIDRLTLAFDLAPKAIRVNAVNPSFVPTRIRRYAGDTDEAGLEAANAFAQLENTLQPLEHRCVTPEEVAETILFLSSKSASFITGHCMPVDGGRRMMGALIMPNYGAKN